MKDRLTLLLESHLEETKEQKFRKWGGGRGKALVAVRYSGILVLELNLFWKAVSEAICSKT